MQTYCRVKNNYFRWLAKWPTTTLKFGWPYKIQRGMLHFSSSVCNHFSCICQSRQLASKQLYISLAILSPTTIPPHADHSHVTAMHIVYTPTTGRGGPSGSYQSGSICGIAGLGVQPALLQASCRPCPHFTAKCSQNIILQRKG